MEAPWRLKMKARISLETTIGPHDLVHYLEPEHCGRKARALRLDHHCLIQTPIILIRHPAQIRCTSRPHPVYIPPTSGVHSAHIRCTSRPHPVYIPPTSGVHPAHIRFTSRPHPVYIPPTSGVHPANIRCTSRPHPVYILPTSGVHPAHIRCTSRPHPVYILPTSGVIQSKIESKFHSLIRRLGEQFINDVFTHVFDGQDVMFSDVDIVRDYATSVTKGLLPGEGDGGGCRRGTEGYHRTRAAGWRQTGSNNAGRAHTHVVHGLQHSNRWIFQHSVFPRNRNR